MPRHYLRDWRGRRGEACATVVEGGERARDLGGAVWQLRDQARRVGSRPGSCLRPSGRSIRRRRGRYARHRPANDVGLRTRSSRSCVDRYAAALRPAAARSCWSSPMRSTICSSETMRRAARAAAWRQMPPTIAAERAGALDEGFRATITSVGRAQALETQESQGVGMRGDLGGRHAELGGGVNSRAPSVCTHAVLAPERVHGFHVIERQHRARTASLVACSRQITAVPSLFGDKVGLTPRPGESRFHRAALRRRTGRWNSPAIDATAGPFSERGYARWPRRPPRSRLAVRQQGHTVAMCR